MTTKNFQGSCSRFQMFVSVFNTIDQTKDNEKKKNLR